jgi:hypothetical protein
MSEIDVDKLSEADLDILPEGLRAAVAVLVKERDNAELGDFSRAQSMTFFGHGLSKQIQIETTAEVVTYLDGGKKRIERRSAFNRKIRLLIASNPVGAPQPKIREVPTAFVNKPKKPRPRTEAELAGLAKGNERRRAEAEERRRLKAQEVETTI